MDSTPQRPGDDGIGFLDFGDHSGGGGDLDGGALLDFGDHGGPGYAEESAIEALATTEPVTDTATTAVLADALPSDAATADGDAGDDEGAEPIATVTNPQGTVSVTAGMDGRIQRVRLDPGVAGMTEAGLADEIFVIADLARQQALSIQRTFVMESFHALGAHDDEALADMLENGVTELPSPERAAQARADVFATRYPSDGR